MSWAKEEVNSSIFELFAHTDQEAGIYGPGYEERRRQRLKENYGIDVPEPYYKTSSS